MGTRVKKPGFWKGVLLTLAILALIRFATDKNDTQYNAAEPAPATVQPVYLPSVPESLQNNVFLQGRGQGACDSLTGDVTMLVIFVDDPEAAWTQEQIAQEKQKIAQTVERIQHDAATYNAQLNLTVEYLTATADIPLADEAWRDWTASVLQSLPVVETGTGMAYEFENYYQADAVPVVFCTSRGGRSFANQHLGNPLFYEGTLLYENTDALYHEVCHLFGAEDYYYPKEVKNLAQLYMPDSIMLSSSYATLDNLTAYLIGWTDTLNSESLQFLRETAHLTQEYMNEQHELETYTGYVEDFEHTFGVYTGHLVDGVPHGQGILIHESGARYEGTFHHGQLYGQGIFVGSNGDRYEGEFVNGMRHGQGIFTWAEGSYYEGAFHNGVFHGQGTFVGIDGSRYEGTFESGLRHGQGILTWADGSRYEGAFENGQRTGYGVLDLSSGNRYEGSFLEGAIHGRGLFLWTNGDRYEGEFANGMRHGQGIYMWADGTTRSGLWNEGEFVG